MRRWLIFAILAAFFSGCKAMTHPDRDRPVKADQDIHAEVPSGERCCAHSPVIKRRSCCAYGR